MNLKSFSKENMQKGLHNVLSLVDSSFDKIKKIDASQFPQNLKKASLLTITGVMLATNLQASDIDKKPMSVNILAKNVIEIATFNKPMNIIQQEGLTKEAKYDLYVAFNKIIPFDNYESSDKYTLDLLNKIIGTNASSLENLSKELDYNKLKQKKEEFGHFLKENGASKEVVENIMDTTTKFAENIFHKRANEALSKCDLGKGDYGAWFSPKYGKIGTAMFCNVINTAFDEFKLVKNDITKEVENAFAKKNINEEENMVTQLGLDR